MVFCLGKSGCGEQNKTFNLMDVTGVGMVCLGSRFGRLGVSGFQVAFCYGHGNNVRRPSVGASGQKRKGKPWVWTVGCQLGWAIFHKSRMWAILGKGGGGSLSQYQSVGNLGKNGGIRAARITRGCGRPWEKQWGSGILSHSGCAGNLWRKNGWGLPFSSLECG